MIEREIAENICRFEGKQILEENGGITMSGMAFAEKYLEKIYRTGTYDIMDIQDRSMALRHWVEAIGYDDKGEYKYIISKHILNC